ncbi:lysozyme-like isoform X2 [Diabrotica undecimpunctata]|uniref:lysozyme-like isoform X2 n=1 Tax=Diabrotica undecimpunctata TaxID=50387 RepID=UPI003B634D12
MLRRHLISRNKSESFLIIKFCTITFNTSTVQCSTMKVSSFCCFIVIGLVIVGTIDGKVYTKCGLTQELLRIGFSRSLVGNWVCMIESESGKDTSKQVNKANGGKALGLFQINSKDWCKYGSPGGKCNMKCEDLINEDITDDARCARKIEAESGFRSWSGWTRNCYGRVVSIPNC